MLYVICEDSGAGYQYWKSVLQTFADKLTLFNDNSMFKYASDVQLYELEKYAHR